MGLLRIPQITRKANPYLGELSVICGVVNHELVHTKPSVILYGARSLFWYDHSLEVYEKAKEVSYSTSDR